MKRYRHLLIAILILGILAQATPAYAENIGRDASIIVRGVGRVVGSVFAIPKAMIQDSGRVMFPFGIVTGAVRGTVQMVAGIFGGTLEVAKGATPYAKYAAMAL